MLRRCIVAVGCACYCSPRKSEWKYETDKPASQRYCLWPEATVLASMIVAEFRRNAGWEQGVGHAQRAVAQCELIAADGSANFR